MEARIDMIDKRLVAVETDVAVIRSNYVTKADLAALESQLLRWFIGTTVTLGTITIAAVKFIH